MGMYMRPVANFYILIYECESIDPHIAANLGFGMNIG